MNRELPVGWNIKPDGYGRCIISVPIEPYVHRQSVLNYSKIPVPPVYGPNDHPVFLPPPCPKDLEGVVVTEIKEHVHFLQDYAIAQISPDKLVYHGVPSLGISPMAHNPTHILLENNSNWVSVALVPLLKPVGNYQLMSPTGGSSTIIYNPSFIVHRKKSEDKVSKEDYANAYDEKTRAAAVEAAFNRFQNIIDEGRYRIHVFVKDLEDTIFFEEIE
jgi:hypothetical protein